MESDTRGAVTAQFRDVVHGRRSTRGFHSTPVPHDVLQTVLADAQQTPSNCNIQPWEVHIVTGHTRDRLSAALLEADSAGETSLDFTFDTAEFGGKLRERSQAQGGAYYGALGIARDDAAGRRASSRRNLTFYGAPAAALLFLPSIGDDVRVASDVGMYAQTFMLALTAQGLASVPQTILGFYADTVRDVLGIGGDKKLLFGISFGYADVGSVTNNYDVGRAPVSECVTFYD